MKIKPITLPLPYRLGSVNCYLIETVVGYVLIDTGASNQRVALERELKSAGCNPGHLKLILLTHGDFDHIGNAAYLRDLFGADIAIHRDDAGMAKRGDMFWNRQSGNALIRWMAPILFRFGKSNRFEADLFVDEGYDLSGYGFAAKVVAIPGHSKGSIAVLKTGGDLFCGDLFDNTEKPVLNSIMDDHTAALDSVEKLGRLLVRTVYPGHGKPFLIDDVDFSVGR
jgi:glyoxylase-like metal-dependent hydrolase (beta-lactamase superfamily II)